MTASAVVPRGTLRMTASISFGAGYLAPAIAEFQRRHPQLRFDIELSDRVVDLVDERIDLAIRIGDIGSQALIGRRIGIAQMVCCASPPIWLDTVRRTRPPISPTTRALRTSIRRTATCGASRTPPAAARSESDRACACEQRCDACGPCGRRASASSWSRTSSSLPTCAPGGSCALLRDYMPPTININAAYPSRRHLSAKVRTFIDFLVLRFERDPPWRLASCGQGIWILPPAAQARRTGAERRARRRQHDRRRRLPAHLLDFAHRALDARFRRLGIACDGIGKRVGVDVEADRQRSHVRHQLRFALVHRARAACPGCRRFSPAAARAACRPCDRCRSPRDRAMLHPSPLRSSGYGIGRHRIPSFRR